MDNFIGWALPDKVAMLLGIQQARLTGQVVRLQTAHGVYTEFNLAQTNVNQLLREVEYSIASEPEPDADSPMHDIWAKCAANSRNGVTRQSHY
ncbi:MAG: hypothetical protein ABFD89_06810 [Bryobacteraceae bacterium]